MFKQDPRPSGFPIFCKNIILHRGGKINKEILIFYGQFLYKSPFRPLQVSVHRPVCTGRQFVTVHRAESDINARYDAAAQISVCRPVCTGRQFVTVHREESDINARYNAAAQISVCRPVCTGRQFVSVHRAESDITARCDKSPFESGRNV